MIPYTGGPLVVDASLNGVPLRLVLDTGADRTLISPAAMARAGFDASGSTQVHIRGVTGDAVATLVSVPGLDVAGTRVGPVAVVVHALPGQGADGLLGRDVLDAFTLTVDAAAQRATLDPPLIPNVSPAPSCRSGAFPAWDAGGGGTGSPAVPLASIVSGLA